ncbi:putative transcription factor [Aspergillus clavatus NRRL 1]|uniref:Fungal specific transcription factor, putative n=1 Tax=Aspergillus clavatus (strain ATCC 1007 / CBS 513.65 / DSM 816 / NCTC 3887 / NRRL 1 / QM 1276 / 107) TaxID=344612 RepID=A1CT65_ASPCL|nr:fungal specific transcription factor, putative [Aspergillus clavatus NRRL 1]EAW06502.1 fungal specific transcription factor, putative [Aspergillus clavatus NRRL 1]
MVSLPAMEHSALGKRPDWLELSLIINYPMYNSRLYTTKTDGQLACIITMTPVQDRLLKPLRRQRLRITTACETCRLRKVKCDGARPACARCLGRGKTCTYSLSSLPYSQQPKRRLPPVRSHAPAPVSPPASRAPSLDTSSQSVHVEDQDRPQNQDLDADVDQNRPMYTAHGRFAVDVAAAIDVRAGLAPAAISNLVPFVDAPLFGETDLHAAAGVPSGSAGLPHRAYADRLVDIYWRYVDPVEPILDRERFTRDYEASYARPDLLSHADREIWVSVLNVVFALAVQRQESIPCHQRNEEGNRYFQRAWAVLLPETILWNPGSLELVQCLMLMNRYLHCTNNQQKTWMTAGLAMRITQSLCGQQPEATSTKEAHKDRQLKQRVWASCVALDRCVSWSLGRTSAPSLAPLPNKSETMCSTTQAGTHAEHFTHGLELHEIGNQIQLAQTQTRNGLVARLRLPRLYQQDEYHAVAVQLDACLNRWEDSLPSDCRLQNLSQVVDRTARAERYLLHLRLLHSRIFLYRPLLARFYSMRSHTATATAPQTSHPPSLSDRLLRECAGMCVEAAQKVTSLVIAALEPNEPMGLLPWWYRIYYLHIAGTNFLAAMFGADLFTESVAQSWRDVLAALRAHEHLSTYVSQCIRTFETLSTRILETRYPTPESGALPLEAGTSGLLFDDIFQDAGFDFDAFLFGMEEIMEGPR